MVIYREILKQDMSLGGYKRKWVKN